MRPICAAAGKFQVQISERSFTNLFQMGLEEYHPMEFVGLGDLVSSIGDWRRGGGNIADLETPELGFAGDSMPSGESWIALRKNWIAEGSHWS